MAQFHYTVVVEADTQEQAEKVMTERVYFEEEYDDDVTGKPFAYTIEWKKADERVRGALTRLMSPTSEGEESADFDVDDVALVCEFAAQFA